MRSLDDRVPCTSEISIALIVGDDQYDVGLGSKESGIDKEKTRDSEDELDHKD
jgi:hypothetical protein